MFTRSLILVALTPLLSHADEPTARVGVAYHNYTRAIELKLGTARAVFCPQVGGRVLEFSVDGKNALYLDDEEKNWKPGKAASVSAGRFDYGPELTVAAHPRIWAGEWAAELTKGKVGGPLA